MWSTLAQFFVAQGKSIHSLLDATSLPNFLRSSLVGACVSARSPRGHNKNIAQSLALGLAEQSSCGTIGGSTPDTQTPRGTNPAGSYLVNRINVPEVTFTHALMEVVMLSLVIYNAPYVVLYFGKFEAADRSGSKCCMGGSLVLSVQYERHSMRSSVVHGVLRIEPSASSFLLPIYTRSVRSAGTSSSRGGRMSARRSSGGARRVAWAATWSSSTCC
jgi:hypothetical protein